MTTRADKFQEVLTRYADGPANLESALAGLAEADLDLALSADSWSIRQIVHHIADGDDIWKICIKAALGNSDGLFTLQWYWDKPQVAWSQNWHYASRNIESSLALLCANRQHIMDLIQQTPDSWEKSIWLKPPSGDEERVTIEWVLEIQGQHIVEHIKDIQAIRQVHNA